MESWWNDVLYSLSLPTSKTCDSDHLNVIGISFGIPRIGETLGDRTFNHLNATNLFNIRARIILWFPLFLARFSNLLYAITSWTNFQSLEKTRTHGIKIKEKQKNEIIKRENEAYWKKNGGRNSSCKKREKERLEEWKTQTVKKKEIWRRKWDKGFLKKGNF